MKIVLQKEKWVLTIHKGVDFSQLYESCTESFSWPQRYPYLVIMITEISSLFLFIFANYKPYFKRSTLPVLIDILECIMNCSAISHKKPQLDPSLQIPASCPWCAWDRADAPLSALIITRQGLLFFNKRDNWLSLSSWLCLVSGNGNGSDQMPRSRSQSSLIREGPANLRTMPLQKQWKGQLTAEWSPLRPSVRAQVKGWWRRSILTGPYGDHYG